MHDNLSEEGKSLTLEWTLEACRKLRERFGGDIGVFADCFGIDYFSCFWFFKGNLVRYDDFMACCHALGIDSDAAALVI